VTAAGRAVVWFRRDLRLTDNPAWSAATRAHVEVLPVFVLDPALLDPGGPFRRDAVLGAVAALDDALAGRLHVAAGDPRRELPRLVAAVGADTLSLNRDVTPYATARDAVVRDRLDATVDEHWGTVVHAPGTITTAEGTVPRVFSAFWRRWQDRDLPSDVEPGAADVITHPGSHAIPGTAVRAGAGADPGARLEEFLAHGLADYPEQRDRPAVDGTSRLSIALKVGALGPATAARAAAAAGTAGDVWIRQLCWRDWYAHLLAEDPTLVDHAQRPEYDRIAWRDDAEGLAAWREGRTGVPIVDAGMRQLATTGWMHNRVRMITASFLVKDLLVDWRLGERHFRRLLADADVPQNVGNWQWVAGTGPDAAPYFRVFNPTLQSRKFDPGGEYLRRWVPELTGLDDRAIHEPSMVAPLELAAAGVTLGADYPFPIVDHAAARDRAIAAYKSARAT
jgi:deoxyribodipyrimidine photo-lyase